MIKRLGIFGGSFNPVHMGHCIMAEHFVEQMKLDRCLFIPTRVSPFKVTEPLPLNQHQRLQMLRMVCRSNPRFHIDDFELRRATISYTIDTVNYLINRYDGAELFLLVGSDQAQNFEQWREWERLLELTTLCIGRRPFIDAETERNLVASFSRHGKQAQVLNTPFIEISSRDIRERRAQSKSIRFLVPDKVGRYIRQHHLYTADAL